MQRLRFFIYIFPILCFVVYAPAYGQNRGKQDKIDSLNLKFKKDSAHIYRFKIIRPFVAIDNRNSFIKEGPVNVKGFQLGVILKEKHTIGFGTYALQNNSKQNLTSKDINSVPLKRTLDLNYLTLFYRYRIIDKRFFELAAPLEVGLGGYHIKLIDDRTDKLVSEVEGGTMLTSGGVDIVLKPFKWIGLTGSAGYRIALEKNPNVNFNGTYYSYGVWVDLRQIYRDIKFYGFTRKKHRRQLKELSGSL